MPSAYNSTQKSAIAQFVSFTSAKDSVAAKASPCYSLPSPAAIVCPRNEGLVTVSHSGIATFVSGKERQANNSLTYSNLKLMAGTSSKQSMRMCDPLSYILLSILLCSEEPTIATILGEHFCWTSEEHSRKTNQDGARFLHPSEWREDAPVRFQEDDAQDLLERLWDLYDDVQEGVVPLGQARERYNYIRVEATPGQERSDDYSLNDIIDDASLVDFVMSCGVP